MKKFAIASFSLLAILLLSVTPFIDSFGIKSAEAYYISIQWGHLAPGFDANEQDAETAVCNYIQDLFYNDYYSTYNTWNAYWNYTTAGNVSACLDMQNDFGSVYFVTNWWVGDYHPDASLSPAPWGHLWFHGHDGHDISDDFVHDHATDYGYVSSKQGFNFIWTCANGGLWWNDNSGNYDNIGGIFYPLPTPSPVPTNTNDEYGYWTGTPPYATDNYGMPFAWTGHLELSIDGYANPSGDYCYIGFEGPSPFMQYDLPETSVDAGWFPINFYIFALGYVYPWHQNIYNSLDFASDETYGCSFSESPLYNGYWNYLDETEAPPEGVGWWFCHMRVFGNTNLALP